MSGPEPIIEIPTEPDHVYLERTLELTRKSIEERNHSASYIYELQMRLAELELRLELLPQSQARIQQECACTALEMDERRDTIAYRKEYMDVVRDSVQAQREHTGALNNIADAIRTTFGKV